ncbi:unnamed protein product [marine sediment metagenome]|uniref:Cytidyltransferase-like domain-containing protein n=1 Tax=marine sediment metagenome TaxID=412755 RepID=X1BZV8_9ZZZZ
MLNLIGMGGTFDHLHDGHKYLIETALSISHQVVIGLTSQKMLKRKKVASKIEDYETRKKNIENFISSITELDRVKIVELNDPYGPPIKEPEEVVEETKKLIKNIAPEGRFILAPAHSHSEIDMSKEKVMLEAVWKYGKYPINL